MREQRRHELNRIVRLEVGSLIRNPSVGGAVRLVETIFRKARDEVEDSVGGRFGDAIDTRATLDKATAFLGHLFPVLLAHGAPQKIGLAERIALQARWLRAAPVPDKP